MILPTLYKKTSTGASQAWTIAVEGNTIVTTWGQLNGAIQETRDTVETGKNIGKTNETSPEQQAQAEAEAQWNKKLKKGYVQSLDDAREGKTDAIITGGILPMLAEKFSEQEHKIVYPCYVQPKLDGNRCIAMLDAEGRATLWTRSRKPITSMKHIEEALYKTGLINTILDGELYNHDYKDRFEELTSFIRSPEPKPGAEVVQFHIYDAPSQAEYGFGNRLDFLGFLPEDSAVLVRVYTEEVMDREGLMSAMDAFLDEGYEGAMARNAAGKYVNKRSSDLQKIKVFIDAEFKVIGVEEGRGKLKGHAIFVCCTEEGVPFRAKLKGSTSELRQYFDDPSLAVGRWLTVKYQGLTNAAKVPRFPVATRFREDI